MKLPSSGRRAYVSIHCPSLCCHVGCSGSAVTLRLSTHTFTAWTPFLTFLQTEQEIHVWWRWGVHGLQWVSLALNLVSFSFSHFDINIFSYCEPHSSSGRNGCPALGKTTFWHWLYLWWGYMEAYILGILELGTLKTLGWAGWAQSRFLRMFSLLFHIFAFLPTAFD